ncbi:restriction endonuclease subunit S [Acinetobacter sp. ANC 4635]|uniref:restriction endonuclease subunit S n=1 Tax=Acinetobacter sp. ANC 4635 TaxID=2529846 RepID=UPI0010395DB4|nr:restriction endonuclease subunit S [Acinetobacter sp. ANC 4635]TCB24467.1 restriction endonuclease subunit S [Acinetobacter sp. ANC 4635]
MVHLGDLFEFKNGRSFSKNEWQESGIKIIRIQNLNDFRAGYNYFQGDYDSAIEVNNGDLLFSWSGTVGSSFGPHIWERDTGLLNQHIFKISFKTDMLLKYAYYSLLFITEEVERSVVGAVGLVHITKKALNEFKIPAPPVSEQKRIVAILDEVFANIEQARTNTEQNLKSARELFESYLQQVFSQRGEGWIETSLGCIAEFKNGLNFSQSSKGEKLKVVGVKDFKSNFMVPFEQLETVQIDGDLSEAYELKENDIIIVRSNGNKRLIGRCLLMGKVDNKTSYSGFTIRIRLSNKNISPKFLAYYLKSSSTHELLINSGGGANISNLNQKILNSLPIAFPHFDQQIQLVDAIEKVEQESQELEKVYANKLILIEELKKSILLKAFTGELTK